MSTRFKEIYGDVKVGDTVKINAGYTYPGHIDMARKLGADIQGGLWVQNRSIKNWKHNNKEIGKVLNIIHEISTYYALVKINGEEYVIGTGGLSKIDPASIILPDSMFEL